MNANRSPKVTVLMAVYNGAPYLSEAVDSILGQTFRDFEFVIIDDASTDDSVMILKDYGDQRIRLVRNDINMGLSASLNRGIELARGEYIARMDADDVSLPERLAMQTNFMDAHPLVDISGTWVEWFDGDQSAIWTLPVDDDEIKCYLLFSPSVYHPTVMFRKRLFDDSSVRYSTAFAQAQDYELWSRLMDVCVFSNLNSVLLRYRLHEQSVGRASSDGQLAHATMVRKLMLQKLGFEPTTNELFLHSELSLNQVPRNEEMLQQTHDWLLALTRQNDSNAIFPQHAFYKVVAERWYQLCSRSTSLGNIIWHHYYSSPLSAFVRTPCDSGRTTSIYPDKMVENIADTDTRFGTPKIALVVDRRDWAFANIARHLTRRLAHRYAFDIYYTEDYISDYDRLITDIYTNQYEIVHYFWREIILNLYIHILRSRLSQLDEITESFFNTKLTFSIYDHCLLEPADLRNFQIVFKYLADGYVVSSERLQSIYRKICDYPAPHRVIEDGVDLADFYPHNTDRLLDSDRPVIVGWAGNSKWGMDLTTFDFKGFHSIIKPAIEELQAEGLAIEGRFADRNVTQIPYQEMVQYYNAIDIYLCASAIEGTPNPILESFACGVPVISTDVGIVPQLFGTEQKRFILNVRSKQELKDKLRLLVQTPALRKCLSEENLKRIKEWTRDREADKWHDFFDRILAGQDETRKLLKRACLEVPYNYGIEATIDHFLKDSVSWKLTRPLRWLNWHVNRLLSMLKERRASRR